MAYASYQDVEKGFRTLSASEITRCNGLLDEIAVIIDSYNVDASEDRKKLVSCTAVRRVLGAGDSVPVGVSNGSMSVGGYSQSWTMSGGTVGELYLSRTEKHLLGVSKIGISDAFEVKPYGWN